VLPRSGEMGQEEDIPENLTSSLRAHFKHTPPGLSTSFSPSLLELRRDLAVSLALGQ
jgi:hypothetical protein